MSEAGGCCGTFKELAEKEAEAAKRLGVAAASEAAAHDERERAVEDADALERELVAIRSELVEKDLQLLAAERSADKAQRKCDELAQRFSSAPTERANSDEKLREVGRRAKLAEQRADDLAKQLRKEQAQALAASSKAAEPAKKPRQSDERQAAGQELRAATKRIAALEKELQRRPVILSPPTKQPRKSRAGSDARDQAETQRLRRENDELRSELMRSRRAAEQAASDARLRRERVAEDATATTSAIPTELAGRWAVPESEADEQLRRHLAIAVRAGYRPDQDRLVKTLVSLYRAEHELARWQEEKGLPVTAQRIRPGTDLQMVAVCEAIILRWEYPSTLNIRQYRQHIDRTQWPFHLDSQAELKLWEATIRRKAAIDIAMGKEEG